MTLKSNEKIKILNSGIVLFVLLNLFQQKSPSKGQVILSIKSWPLFLIIKNYELLIRSLDGQSTLENNLHQQHTIR